jgi:alpha-1,2-mannosyltransferase
LKLLVTRAPDLSGHRLFLAIAAPLFALYLATATWTMPYGIDAGTNVLTAWELGERGDVFLDRHAALASEDYYGIVGWVSEAGDSFASRYPPGAAALAAPLYAIWPAEASILTIVATSADTPDVEIPIPPLAPAAIVSAAVASIAMGILGLAFRELADGRSALLGGYVAGLGTGAWAVAADALWQHGPGMMWLAAGTLLSIRHRAWAGVAFGAAILTRPHTALVSACNGIWQSAKERSVRPAVLVGLGSAAGLALLLLFNEAVFGSASVTGGYGESVSSQAASLDILDYLGNVALAFVHPVRGLLPYSPFLILLLPGIPAAWRAAPAWVRGSALGGLLYLLLQLKANRYSGGYGFWAYRYPLEPLAAAAPLLFLAYTEWVAKQSALIQKFFRWLVVASVAITTIGALTF